MYTNLLRVLIESVCINADFSSLSLSFFDLNRFGGMSNCTIDKIGQMLLETVHYGRVEIVFTLLPFSFTVMDLVPSSKRSHLSTGTTPHKPAEKRSKEGINPKIRGPLCFSSENVPCSLRENVKRCPSSPKVNISLHSPYRV